MCKYVAVSIHTDHAVVIRVMSPKNTQPRLRKVILSSKARVLQRADTVPSILIESDYNNKRPPLIIFIKQGQKTKSLAETRTKRFWGVAAKSASITAYPLVLN